MTEETLPQKTKNEHLSKHPVTVDGCMECLELAMSHDEARKAGAAVDAARACAHVEPVLGCRPCLDRLRGTVANLSEDLSDQVFHHAACLSIAEGAPDWRKFEPKYGAARAVMRLRENFERLEEERQAAVTSGTVDAVAIAVAELLRKISDDLRDPKLLGAARAERAAKVVELLCRMLGQLGAR